MKPCSKNRKHLALLAIGDLETPRDRELRAHLEVCAACREYLAQITKVSENLREIEPETEVHASQSFHRKALDAIRASESNRGIGPLLARVQSLLDWRVSLPAVAVIAVMIALLLPVTRPPAVPSVPTLPARAGTTQIIRGELEPTAGNYQMVANQSLEKLDELITLQGRLSPPSTPVYTASLFPRSDASD